MNTEHFQNFVACFSQIRNLEIVEVNNSVLRCETDQLLTAAVQNRKTAYFNLHLKCNVKNFSK